MVIESFQRVFPVLPLIWMQRCDWYSYNQREQETPHKPLPIKEGLGSKENKMKGYSIKKDAQIDSKGIAKVLTCEGDKGNMKIALMSLVEGRYVIATFGLS